MAHESTSAPSCLSAFSQRSRSNGLAHNASSDISTLYVRSWGALALGVICAGVTGLVIFEDVLRNKAPITTDHVLTAAVIVITAAAGHMWWRRLWSSAFITGLGLLLIFGAGLVYLVVASGGRNAEVAANKRNAAHWANTERLRIKPLLEDAEKMLTKATEKIQADCVEGKRGKGHCDGLRTTRDVYEAAVKGRKGELEKLGPEQEEDGALKATARAIVAFKGITGDEREKTELAYVERLEIVLPYVKALLVEIATVVFLGVGIGHRETVPQPSMPTRGTVPQCTSARKPRRTVPQPATIPHGTVPRSATVLRPTFGRTVLQGTVPLTQDKALELLLGTIAKSGLVPQDDLPELFQVRAKSTVSRWCRDWEHRGLISRIQSGRSKFVTLSERQAV